MSKRIFILITVLFTSLLAAPTHAGLFDDDEARKAILDLRKKVDAINNQLAAKSDKTVILDQVNQLGSLQDDIAKLRGQVEVLTNQIDELQRQQKNFYTDLDNRLRKLEPQKVVVDGKEAQVEVSEQQSYDKAQAAFQAGDYAGAASAFAAFIKAHPRSAYLPNAYYSQGIAYYARKNYKGAIAAFQSLVKGYPDNAKAPDALLNMASCYSEQKDTATAKKLLQRLKSDYPDSSAAQTAADRLNALK